MNNIIIAPSILSSDFANLQRDINMLENNKADWIHIDVMDGHFVPNLTIGAPVVKSIRRVTNLTLDVHLMIDNPQKYIKDFALSGADIITFHYEAVKGNVKEVIEEIKSYDKKVGISIKPNTPVGDIAKYINETDLVLIMTVEPGFGAQSFIYECADKIKSVRDIAKKDIIIEVDGGINDKTAKICIEKGANALVSGNYIFTSKNVKEAIASLRL